MEQDSKYLELGLRLASLMRMPRCLFWTCVLLFLVLPIAARAQSFGSAPSPRLTVTDLYSAFRLPPLMDAANDPLAPALSATQVGARAAVLGLNSQSPLDAWNTAAKVLETAARIDSPPAASTVAFTGATASALNRVLASGASSIILTAPSLAVDQPIEIPSRVTLDLQQTLVTSATATPYMLRIDGASRVTVRGGQIAFGEAGILVNNSDSVRIEGVDLHDLTSDGIVVTGSQHVVVTGNRIHGVSGAAILLHRGTAYSVVEHNRAENNLGPSNMTAGIVLSDREVDLASNPLAIFGPDGYWVIAQPITSRLDPPHDNAIAYNDLFENASSGIYLDGAVRNAVVGNTMRGNTKEGLCLDNGATANVVASNIVQQNGDRWGELDWVLAEDQILAGGRLADGTAAEKAPGISLDNALYNIVFENNVTHNYGGGIKIVRTGFFNLIGLNTLFSDNDGSGPAFHFFGIELGAATGSDTAELDYTPSEGNLVFSNAIRGTHYSGIFFDAGSTQNNVFDNTIMDATNWALESVQVMTNYTLNNLTNLQSRNIGSGLDPSLLTVGQPVYDSGLN